MNSCVVLFSGGQDSTTCLYWAKKVFDSVIALGFNYGQKHVIELQQADKIAKDANVNYKIVNLQDIFSNSGLLLNTELSTSEQHPVYKNLPSSFVPGRNAVFLNIAASYAASNEIYNIVGGMCETDYSGYPDCRREFIDSVEKSFSLAIQNEIKIHTPLMYLSKAHTWQLADNLGILDIIIEDTHTDYNGDRTTKNEWGYGKLDNPASVLRAKGYFEAKENGWI